MTVVPIDDFSPVVVGDTGSPFVVQFLHRYTNTPIDLTGCTISMRMQNAEDLATVKDCLDSAWTTDDAANGIAHYDFQDVDLDTAGTWNMSIKITKASKPVHADVKQLVIQEAI